MARPMIRESDCPWTVGETDQLRQLWAEGHSSAEIGRRLGRTKNAVVGRVHRLALPGRLSPIKGERKPQAPRKELALPRSERGGNRGGLGAMIGNTLQLLGAAPTVPAPLPTPAPPDPPIIIVRKSQPCCWPVGEPRTPEFRYCDAPGVPGRSYCAEHEAKAWVTRPPRAERDEAAAVLTRAKWADQARLSPRTKWGTYDSD